MSMWRRAWLIGGIIALAAAMPAAKAQQNAPDNQGQQNAPDNQGQQQNAPNSQGQQQNQTEAPIPAYHSPFSVTTGDNQDETQTVTPDNRPLTGVQFLSLGTLQVNRSYWQPRFDIAATADSNPEENTNNSGSGTDWTGWGSFLGGVDIRRISGDSDLMIDYTGGGMYSNSEGAANGIVQELGAIEAIRFRRSTLSFMDQLTYLPQAGEGFGGLGGLPLLGAGSTGLTSGFATAQSILTGEGQNLANSSVVQLNIFLTPRSSITFAGGYDLLHFFGNDLLDSGAVFFQGGYNYKASEHNTVGAFYSYTGLRYSNSNESIDVHSVEVSYGRQVTGKLAFQVAAGPEFELFQTPTTAGTGSTGGTTGTGNTGASTSNLGWTLTSALDYRRQRTDFGLSYLHGVTSGSGVFAGAVSDTATGSVTRQMSKTFSSGIVAGYSRNTGVDTDIPTVLGQNSNLAYDYWFAGANFSHPFSETVALTFSYQLQYQTASSAFCIGSTCGTSLVRNLISVGVSWHERPLLF